MTRVQKILIGLLAIQILAIFLFQGPLQSSTSPPERQPLFPGIDELDISRVEVKGAEDEKTVTLVRAGDGWGIEEAGGYPAESAKIDKLLESLEEIEVRRPVVTSARYHKALKVTEKERERHLRLYADAGSSPEVDLFLGTSPNYRSTHVRRAGDDEVYEVSGLGAYDVRDTPAGWIATRLLDVSFEDVTGARFENSSGSFELERMADGSWRVVSDPGRKLDKAEVDSLVRAAASISAAEPEGPIDRAAQGLEPAAATVTLRISVAPDVPEGEADGEVEAAETEPEVREVTVWVGSEVADKDSQRYVAHSDFPYAARAWKGALDRLVDASLSELEPDDEGSES